MRAAFIGTLNRSTWLTHVGLLVALYGIHLAQSQRVVAALMTLVIAGVCDLVDGPVARRVTRTEQQQAFGVQLDSLVDVVSFVVLPIAIVLAILPTPIFLAACAVYALAAITRLAHFTSTASTGTSAATPPPDGSTHYQGLPVTYAALVFPTLALAQRLIDRWIGDNTLQLSAPPAWPWMVALLALAGAFVANIAVPKPRGINLAGFAVLAVVVLVGLAIFGQPPGVR